MSNLIENKTKVRTIHGIGTFVGYDLPESRAERLLVKIDSLNDKNSFWRVGNVLAYWKNEVEIIS